MDTAEVGERGGSSRVYFPWISWGAITGGLASGMATFLLLALFGMASGLSTVKASGAGGSLAVLIASIWTSLSLVLSAFMGGYVSARMSGLSRLADGILHGLVAWGVSTLSFVFLLTTRAGVLVGGNFAQIGKRMAAAASGTASAGGDAALQWALFGGVFLSMLLGMFGGAVGSRGTVRRRRPLRRMEAART